MHYKRSTLVVPSNLIEAFVTHLKALKD